ncbi:MAG: response regulator [Reichenbachiella sp.]
MSNKKPTYQELENEIAELKLEQTQSEEIEFKKSNTLLHPIFGSPKGVIIFSLDLNYCYTAFTVSHKETMKFIWGENIEIGMNMIEVIHTPNDRENATLNFDKALRGEHFIIDEEYGDESLNRSFWENRYSPMYDDKNAIIGLTVFVTDITQRKLIQKELDHQHEKQYELNNALNKAQKLAHIGSWLYNLTTQKIEWSDETFHIFGFDPKESAPDFEKLVNRIHTDDQELFNSSIDKASNLGIPYDIEHRICFPNSEQKTLRAICQPVLAANGEVVSLAGTTQDITAQKLFEAAQFKHQRLKAIGEMSSSIAHDFNNALQEMMGNLEIVKVQKDLSDRTLEGLNNIGSIIGDVAGRVSALQTFGDTAYEDKHAKHIDFNTLIEESLKESRPLWKDGMEKEGLKITVITDFEAIPKISCNSGELKSAIYNLIKNSIEAMPEGGNLMIKTGIKTEGVFATFTDTGIGMDEESQLKIFQPFYSTKGFKLGRGLGMSGVYGTVKKHKGNIIVKSSELGKGTTIEMVFPISQQEDIKVSSENEQKNNESFSVLLVDDDTMITKTVGELVELIGHKCTIVNSGKNALEYLDNNSCDIVFTDIGMPEMNGWELIDTIRNQFGNKMKIVVVSGWNTKEKVKEGHGIDFVLQKPFTLEELNKVFLLV